MSTCPSTAGMPPTSEAEVEQLLLTEFIDSSVWNSSSPPPSPSPLPAQVVLPSEGSAPGFSSPADQAPSSETDDSSYEMAIKPTRRSLPPSSASCSTVHGLTTVDPRLLVVPSDSLTVLDFLKRILPTSQLGQLVDDANDERDGDSDQLGPDTSASSLTVYGDRIEVGRSGIEDGMDEGRSQRARSTSRPISPMTLPSPVWRGHDSVGNRSSLERPLSIENDGQPGPRSLPVDGDGQPDLNSLSIREKNHAAVDGLSIHSDPLGTSGISESPLGSDCSRSRRPEEEEGSNRDPASSNHSGGRTGVSIVRPSLPRPSPLLDSPSRQDKAPPQQPRRQAGSTQKLNGMLDPHEARRRQATSIVVEIPFSSVLSCSPSSSSGESTSAATRQNRRVLTLRDSPDPPVPIEIIDDDDDDEPVVPATRRRRLPFRAARKKQSYRPLAIVLSSDDEERTSMVGPIETVDDSDEEYVPPPGFALRRRAWTMHVEDSEEDDVPVASGLTVLRSGRALETRPPPQQPRREQRRRERQHDHREDEDEDVVFVRMQGPSTPNYIDLDDVPDVQSRRATKRARSHATTRAKIKSRGTEKRKRERTSRSASSLSSKRRPKRPSAQKLQRTNWRIFDQRLDKCLEEQLGVRM